MEIAWKAALGVLDRLGPLADLLFDLGGTLLRLRSSLLLAFLGLSASPRPPRRAGRLSRLNGVFSGRLVRTQSVARPILDDDEGERTFVSSTACSTFPRALS
jgi:hypothetical protein